VASGSAPDPGLSTIGCRDDGELPADVAALSEVTAPTDPTATDPAHNGRDRAASARHAISLIDLTDLSDDHAASGIDALCARAAENHVAAVCVWPEFVARCVELLDGTGVGVATVVNFPKGNQQIGPVLDETLTALSDGATDIDLVLPYKMFRNGDVKPTASLIEAVGDIIAPPGILKVILETGELPDTAAVRSASELAIGLGADFIKTSTGKTPVSATLASARTMLETIAGADRPVGIKPSGGIRTYDDAMAYLDLAAEIMGPEWATPTTFRFGASGLLDALLSELAAGA
jgi:deoxyribose-phosphate aldolase